MKLSFVFGAPKASVSTSEDTLSIALSNSALGSSYSENWDLPEAQMRAQGRFQLIETSSQLCGAISIDLDGQDLEVTARQLYDEVFQITDGWHLHRLWQFIPQINEYVNGIENYQAYNKGRAEAFACRYPDSSDQLLPAASAVGTSDRSVVLAFIAGRIPGTHLENPKQTPAYHYPEKYGPRPPSFARATAIIDETSPLLYVSGTASIRGSDNIGSNLEEQITTTFENIAIMREQYAMHREGAQPSRQKRYRVYIRHPKDFPLIEKIIRNQYREPGDQFHYVVADICRAELDIEIELTLS